MYVAAPSYYAAKYQEFSDDGVTSAGSYGHRWRRRTIDQIDLFEINEAFAVVPMKFMKEMGVPAAKSVGDMVDQIGQFLALHDVPLIVDEAGAVSAGDSPPVSGVDTPAAFETWDDAEAYHVLGGNQGNAVSIRAFEVARVLTYRWPVR